MFSMRTNSVGKSMGRILSRTLIRAFLLALGLVVLCSAAATAGVSQEDASLAAASDYAQDLAAFKRLRGNLVRLSDQIRHRPDLFGPRPEQDATLLRPEIRRQIAVIWYSVLDNYLALDTLGGMHLGFQQLKPGGERERAFHLARGVFLTQYRIALDIITVLERNPAIDTILNEADPDLGLPQGVYARFKYQFLNVIKAGHYAALEAVARVYHPSRDLQLRQWAREDSRVILAAGKGPGPALTFKNGLAIIQDMGQSAWLPVQKGVAEWMGHTKVWRRHRNLIRPDQIKALSRRLAPGDILLERREWYLTNVGIPGFWTHAALFIGDRDQRSALSDQAEVKAWLRGKGAESLDGLIEKRYPRAYAVLNAPCGDGRLPRVIEAIAPGVSLTSLDFSAGCDSLAVLRPRLSKADRAAAVVRAMRYYGRPYDYAFDFGTDTSLVCTELVVKSYLPGEAKKGLRLPLENLMGHMVTPANAFVRQFDEAFGTGDQQMDLVLFWDGDEKENQAVESGLEAFRRSWQRPKWHILMSYAQADPN